MNNEQQEKRERETLAEKISRHLDISPDILPGGSMVVIRSRASVSVSGSTSIMLYTPEEIKLSLKKGVLRILGRRLACTSYNSEELHVEGKISSVSFEEE